MSDQHTALHMRQSKVMIFHAFLFKHVDLIHP